MDIPHEVARSGSRYFDSPEYLELFYQFEPNDIWRMAVTKSERKRVILNRVYDRMEIYLARLVEYYRKALPSLAFDEWYFERRRHTEGVNSIAYYDSSCSSIHYSLSAFMYGELELRLTIHHEMCHVKYGNHGKRFWKLLYDTALQVRLKDVSYKEGTRYSETTVCVPCVNYTIPPGRPRKKQPGFFTEIARHTYQLSPEIDAISVKAKEIADDMNHSDYLTEKLDHTVNSLWEYTNAGSYRAARLLSDTLYYAMEYHNLDTSKMFYLAQERMLNLGFHKLHDAMLDNFYFGEYIDYKYDMKAFDELIAAGSGLACINKADRLIANGENQHMAIALYYTAAQRGYSVGLRALYCIFQFIKDKKRSDMVLEEFESAAPMDNTNWRYIEMLIYDRIYARRVLSILSENPQIAKLYLMSIYENY